jgi:hypothetical protein
MSTPTFKTTEVAQLYEEIGGWSHPEYPFLDPNYSEESSIPAIDFTPYVTTWLAAGPEAAVAELWSYLTYQRNASTASYELRQALQARLPSWVELSDTAKHELHAIFILTWRAGKASVGTRLAATTLACRQMALDPAFANGLMRLARSELRKDEGDDPASTEKFDEKARLAVEQALSPLGAAASASERLKAVPPMVRCVVFDYISRGWAEGTLRFDLYYDERRYGCGRESNQQYVDWLAAR